ncbi:MAG: hypothetical protein EBS37_16535, partial [Betaproteobacteria bacterium]|nr:hypothetical protein [Betaproteobacteria bacterium]
MGMLVVLMLCETQLAVMLVDRTGEMTSALAAQDRDRFWSAVRICLLVLGDQDGKIGGNDGSGCSIFHDLSATVEDFDDFRSHSIGDAAKAFFLIAVFLGFVWGDPHFEPRCSLFVFHFQETISG